MELTTFGAFSAYWVKQGWSQQGPIKTESRIDVPKGRSTVAAGQVTIAGVAWAQHTGIEAVEVGVDGVWYTAKLPAQDTIDTWRQWYYVWDATPGQHVLQVRATDKTGYTQTAVVHKTEPDGATGYHTIPVNHLSQPLARTRFAHHRLVLGPLTAALPARRPAVPHGSPRGSQRAPRAQRALRAVSRSSSASRLCALTTASQYGHAAAMPPTSGR